MYDCITIHALGDGVYQTKSFDEIEDYSSQFATYHVDAEGVIKLVRKGWYDKVDLPNLIGEIEFYGPEDLFYRATFNLGKMVKLERLISGWGWEMFQHSMIEKSTMPVASQESEVTSE